MSNAYKTHLYGYGRSTLSHWTLDVCCLIAPVSWVCLILSSHRERNGRGLCDVFLGRMARTTYTTQHNITNMQITNIILGKVDICVVRMVFAVFLRTQDIQSAWALFVLLNPHHLPTITCASCGALSTVVAAGECAVSICNGIFCGSSLKPSMYSHVLAYFACIYIHFGISI